MPSQDQVFDNPTGWVADHIRRYVKTNGREGHRFNGHDSLLLTTRGRHSGKLRRTALYYGHDGDRYVLVASNGGARRDPRWYLNVAQNPAVVVQVEAEVFGAHARLATPSERPALWELMTELFPPYRDYQRKAERAIPVVVVERA